MFLVLSVLIKCMFQNSVQYRVCLSANWCRNVPLCSDLLLELVLFLFGTALAAAVYMAVKEWKLNY